MATITTEQVKKFIGQRIEIFLTATSSMSVRGKVISVSEDGDIMLECNGIAMSEPVKVSEAYGVQLL